MYETIPLPVISSGGIMLHEDTVKTATASMSREIFLAVGNTGLFNAFHLSRFAANAPPQPSAAPPMGEPSFNGVVWTLIFFTQISILSFYTGTHPPEGKRVTGFSVACGSLRIQFPCHRKRSPLPLKREGCGCFGGGAAGTQISTLKSQLFLFHAPIHLYALSAAKTKKSPPSRGALFIVSDLI
jgi:hypothetical protein